MPDIDPIDNDALDRIRGILNAARDNPTHPRRPRIARGILDFLAPGVTGCRILEHAQAERGSGGVVVLAVTNAEGVTRRVAICGGGRRQVWRLVFYGG
jgi:hypothetical protein